MLLLKTTLGRRRPFDADNLFFIPTSVLRSVRSPPGPLAPMCGRCMQEGPAPDCIHLFMGLPCLPCFARWYFARLLSSEECLIPRASVHPRKLGCAKFSPVHHLTSLDFVPRQFPPCACASPCSTQVTSRRLRTPKGGVCFRFFSFLVFTSFALSQKGQCKRRGGPLLFCKNVITKPLR